MTATFYKIPENLLKQMCGKETFERGVSYAKQGQVKQILANPNPQSADFSIHSTVSGSGNRAYKVTIEVLNDEDTIIFFGNCSCPVGEDCKHVVATSLVFNQRIEGTHHDSGKPNTGFPRELTHWLSALGNKVPNIEPEPDDYYPVYVLNKSRTHKSLSVEIWLTRPKKNGRGFVVGEQICPQELIHLGEYTRRGKYATALDLEIGQLLAGLVDNSYGWHDGTMTLNGTTGAMALEKMIQSQRCFWRSKEGQALTWGEPRAFAFNWRETKKGYQLSVTPKSLILTTTPPLYWDENTHQAGKAQLPESYTQAQLKLLQSAPTVPKAHAEAFSDQLCNTPLPFSFKPPVVIEATEVNEPPTGHIKIGAIPYKSEQGTEERAHCVWFQMYYGEHRVNFLNKQATEFLQKNDQRFRIHRDLAAEDALARTLSDSGFRPLHAKDDHMLCLLMFSDSLVQSATNWHQFLTHRLPELEADGWIIEQDESFRMLFFEGEWEATTENLLDENESTHDWFDIRFDLKLENNQTLPLAPLIAPLLGQDPETLPDQIVLPLGDDRYTHISTEKLKPYLQTLSELFQRSTQKDNSLKISRFDLATIDELGTQLMGAEKLQAIAKRLKDFSGIETVAVPDSLKATLRPYQHEGLNWLQFLRQYQFNGILADDMGLGKTIQSIAHILIEKEQGRLNTPTLIVAPTSLMGNWRHEVEKFAPSLNITILHGSNRHDHYESLGQSDVIVTTYALVLRDFDLLKKVPFHLLILDEAQAVKNPQAKMSQAVRKLSATHRLCLTGTPMENHLGELWSLFDFLMPGFLSTHSHFKDFYRSPIEKQSNHERMGSLQKRISPFILRRTKADVANDLPEKTEIQHLVAMDTAQAKLYESIRVTMDKQVRDAIAQKGLGQSHITVLDALLKLRQTCCDPRLLKLDQAKQVKHSAKMEALLDLLAQLMSEGRKVLIFSQFTSMLTLIEDALKTQKIKLTKLTGKTRNRDKAIDAFRSGLADVFLISLKAGGTGLNLVEADTVIIYDPWWNPAAENQAIDRAHRIGQKKAVFVYRFIVEGSVEEKIMHLQQHKKALADGIYDEKNTAKADWLDTATIESLFAPIDTDKEQKAMPRSKKSKTKARALAPA